MNKFVPVCLPMITLHPMHVTKSSRPSPLAFDGQLENQGTGNEMEMGNGKREREFAKKLHPQR